ncbi:ABC transporter substrate-binding protein [Prauserella sp. PE36]|uniref:ABC transporter substrate-binding protein n=1 Tax=Prauserella sp. PE36 TaxID=1504709 RepID=UPI001F32A843|nr:ABC transporter substrate-binding protein [Prauserella sp. PE36]
MRGSRSDFVVCGGCSAAVASKNGSAYTIGIVVSQTGSGSQLGVGELQGAQLAVDRINAAGGVNERKLRLMSADDQSNPAQAVLAVRRIVGKVDAIVGPSLSGPCKAVIPLATSAQTVNYCLSPGVKPAAASWQWSASAATEDFTERPLEYWKSQGLTRIGLISTTDPSGVDGASATKHAAAAVGMTVVGAASYSADAVSVTSQLQAVAAGQPQALVVWSTGAAAGVAFKGIREMGLHLPVATTDGNLTYSFLKQVRTICRIRCSSQPQDFWWQNSPRDDAARLLEQQYTNSSGRGTVRLRTSAREWRSTRFTSWRKRWETLRAIRAWPVKCWRTCTVFPASSVLIRSGPRSIAGSPKTTSRWSGHPAMRSPMSEGRTA